MSKSTTRQRVAQLTEWMKTLKSKRVRPVKSGNTNRRNNNTNGYKQR